MSVPPSGLPPGFSATPSGAPNSEASEKKAAEDEQRQSILSAVLEPQARERLSRVSLVQPDKARMLENMVIQQVRSGRVAGRISEEMLIQMLERGSGSEKEQKVKVQRRRSAFDSDDDEDDEDGWNL
eukprot:ANDGO_04875.mRNA.1 Uncharacterized protein C23C4.09c